MAVEKTGTGATGVVKDELPQFTNRIKVKLRFSRYGLVQENESENKQYTFNDFTIKGKPLFPEKAPEVPQYSYCRMPIRDGYLYVYNETLSKEEGKDLWYEYKVTNQDLQSIIWENFSDKNNERKPKVATRKEPAITVRENDIIWVAFSDTQWSAAYAKSSFENKEKRFQKIDTAQWLSILDKDGKAILPKSGDHILYEKSIQAPDASGKKVSRDFMLTKDKNDTFATLHFIIHDPMGAADDICCDIDPIYTQFQSFINSLQIGTENPENLSESSFREAYALHMHGLMFYKIFYDQRNSQNTPVTEEEKRALKEYEKFMKMKKHIVSQEFLEKMLGKEKRSLLRDEINKFRKSLLAFINSEYYNVIMDDYRENTPIRKEIGIRKTLSHIERLASNPSLADKAMEITDITSPISKTIKQYLEKVYKDTEHPVNRLFAEKYDIQDMIDDYDSRQISTGRMMKNLDTDNIFNEQFIAEVDFVWSNMFTIFMVWETFITNKTIIEIPGDWFNKVKIMQRNIDGVKQKFWAVDILELDDQLKNMDYALVDEPVKLYGPGSKEKRGIPVSSQDQQRLIARTVGKKIEGAKLNAEIEVKFHPESTKVRAVNLFSKIFNSKGFLCFSGLISAGNLIVTIKKANNQDIYAIFGSGMGITAAVAELGFYLTHYAKIHLKLTKNTLDKIVGVSKLLGNIAVVALGVSNIMEGIIAINKRNIGAGVTFIASGTFLITGLILSSQTIISLGVAAWYATAAYIIAVGLLILAVYLTDTPIESFLKNCILCKKAMEKISNWNFLSVKEIHVQLLERKTEIVGDKFQQWLNMETSISELMTFFIAQEIRTETFSHVYDPGRYQWMGLQQYYDVTNKVIIVIRPVNVDFNTIFDCGLWIWTEKANSEYTKAIIKIPPDRNAVRETEKGIEITFDLSRYAYLKNMNRVRAFFYHHFILSDGMVFPGNKTNEYYMQKVEIKKLRGVHNILDGIDNYFDYCNKRDRMVCSLEHLGTLIK